MRLIALLVIGFAVVGGLGLIAYYFWGGEEEEITDGTDPLAVTASESSSALARTLASTTEEPSLQRRSRMQALKASLERSLETRQSGAKSSLRDRMRMPWFMLVGAEGSGRRTVLGNAGMALPWGPPIEVDSERKDAGKWWLYESAVVLEAPAPSTTTAVTTTLSPNQQTNDTSEGWNTLLHMLRRERPDSPLNGIVVTISCADLLSARVNSEKMEDQAERIRTFLAKTTEFLGVRLPLHVIVTKCDTMPGFRGFSLSLPEARRNDVFGWSNPNPPVARFEPSWVDRGFDYINQTLGNLRDEVMAAPETVKDPVGVFLFDSEFADLQQPLKAFVARLVTVGEASPTLFFRGFYFVGDALEPSQRKAPAAKPARTVPANGDSAEIPGEPHDMVFTRTLFSEKIFREAGLARPLHRFRLSRDRRVVAAQAAALLIGIVGGGGLWSAVHGISTDNGVYSAGLLSDSRLLTRFLSGVAIDLDDLRRSRADTSGARRADAAVIELVSQMRHVPSMEIRSAFLPSSWFSPLPEDIRASMQRGIQDIVLPVTRQRIDERIARLLSGAAVDGAPEQVLDPENPRSIVKYLNDVGALSRNIAIYNSLADSTSGSVADLTSLLDYLYGDEVAPDSLLSTPHFEEALRRASGRRVFISATMASAVIEKATSVASSVAGRASRQLAPRQTAAQIADIRADDDLAALRGLVSLVELIDPARGVVASVADSVILGRRIAHAVEDSIQAYLQVAAVRAGPDTLSPDSSAKRLRGVIGTLASYQLMAPVESRVISAAVRPHERLLWDVGRLELALSLRTEFLAAAVGIVEAFPGQSPERLQRALELQLRRKAVDVAASAQRFTPLATDVDVFAETKLQSANLESAATRLVRLAVMLDSLGAGYEGRKLVEAGARQAEQAIMLAQAQLERANYLAPQGSRIAAWQGVIPFGYAALGTSSELAFAEQQLRHETDIRTLSHNVGPALRYLRLRVLGDSALKAPHLLASWEEIATAVAKYERGDLSSTMGILHRYLRSDLAVNSLDNCRIEAAQPDSSRAARDIFVLRRHQHRAALVSRCGPRGSAPAVASYQGLRGAFQQRVAGRYPFVDTSSAGSIEADPASVRDFVRMYDAFAITGDISLRSDPSLAQTARQPMQFLEQMSDIRRLMSPFADPDAPRALPEYQLLVSLAKDSVPNGLYELQVGDRNMVVDAALQEWPWRSGDSIKVVFTPFDPSGPKTVFAAGGSWAALRLAQRPPSAISVRVHHPDNGMQLFLRRFPYTATEILIPRR